MARKPKLPTLRGTAQAIAEPPDDIKMVLHPIQSEFVQCEKIYKAFVAGVACVAAETQIDGVPIGDWKEPGVVRTLWGRSVASPASVQCRADLYAVRTRHGRTIKATLNHGFLTPTGWKRLRNLSAGSSVAACETNSDPFCGWDVIESISFYRFGEFYDLHVPGANHYAANGLWNHNSGKSFVGAYDLLSHAKPGNLVVVAAPTFRQLSDATMRSFIEVATQLGLWDENAYRKTDNQAMLSNGVEVLFRSADSPACYDYQTEILTDCGWKLFGDLDRTERVLTLGVGGKAEWHRPVNYIAQQYQGPMVAVNSGKLDLLVTPNHRFLVENQYSGRRRLDTIDCVSQSHDRIPASCGFRGTNRRGITEAHCALMGFYLAEGTAYGNAGGDIAKRKGAYEVFFAQNYGIHGGSKGDVRKQFLDAIKPLGYHIHEKDRRGRKGSSGITIINKSLWQSLIGLGNTYTKFIPKEYKELPQAKLRVLLHWLLMGDGVIRGYAEVDRSGPRQRGGRERVYYTVSKRLADDVQEIAIKAGYGATIRKRPPSGGVINGRKIKSQAVCYAVSIFVNQYNYLCSSKRSYVSRTTYSGMVYCVEVPNHVVMVRRNGRVCWCGNSNRGPSLHRAWLDEAGLMDEEMFNVMIGRLRGGGMQGVLTSTFTPQGKEHWTYRLFADESNPNVQLFHCSTKDNPFIAPEIYENLLLQYGKGEGGMLRAQQELEGQFVCVEGAEWPGSWFGDDKWFDEFPKDENAIRVATLDSSKGIGGKTGDYSSFCKMMLTGGMLLVDFDMDSTRHTSIMAQTAIEIQKEFGPQFFGLEAEFGGSVLMHDLENMSEQQNVLMPMVLIPTQGINKDVRIRRLTPYFSRDMVRFRRSSGTKIAVTQMEVFPFGAHDDGPDSMEMALRLINESGVL